MWKWENFKEREEERGKYEKARKLEDTLAEGLEVEHDLDAIISEWEKSRPPPRLELWERLTDITTVATVLFVVPIIFCTAVPIAYYAMRLPPETRIGWHPHVFYKSCLQYGGTSAMICLNNGEFATYHTHSSPLVRQDLNGNEKSCFTFFQCKQEAEKELNAVVELQRELTK